MQSGEQSLDPGIDSRNLDSSFKVTEKVSVRKQKLPTHVCVFNEDPGS
jgi:hypothetical protein